MAVGKCGAGFQDAKLIAKTKSRPISTWLIKAASYSPPITPAEKHPAPPEKEFQ
jgi:hypothetical protein